MKNTSHLEDITQPEKSNKNKPDEPGTTQYLWYRQVRVETTGKHGGAPLLDSIDLRKKVLP
jgi:hypothetical protein